jgi:ribosomal-protein-alanine acetyltransferase
MNQIRLANPSDLETLLRLEQNFPGDKLSKQSFKHFLTKAHADFLVLEADDEILADALVLYRKGSTSARLYSLVVDPKARGKGLARDLLEACETAAKTHACTQIHLEVREDNQAALALYEHHGYQKTATLKSYYEDGTAAIKMSKRL